MSNRRRRQAKRRQLTDHEKWMRDRYRPHRQMTAREVRKVIVEDGVARRDIPLDWFVKGVVYIAARERRTKEAVMVELDALCQEQCGMPLPRAGVSMWVPQ